MKWLALLLLIANIVLGFYGGPGAPVSSGVKGEGRLPRVSALKVLPAEDIEEGLGAGVSDEADAPPEVGSDPLEPSLGISSEVAEAKKPAGSETTQSGQIEACVEVGWFEDEASAREAANTLGVTENIKGIRAVDRPQAPFHWVIVPPASSRSEANRRYREIRSMDLDAYLVAQGEQENAISLGLFESRSAAERVLTRRKSQGLDAKLVTFPRNRISYALVFSAVLRSGAEAGRSLLGGYESRFESVKFSECEGVATTDKNP